MSSSTSHTTYPVSGRSRCRQEKDNIKVVTLFPKSKLNVKLTGEWIKRHSIKQFLFYVYFTKGKSEDNLHKTIPKKDKIPSLITVIWTDFDFLLSNRVNFYKSSNSPKSTSCKKKKKKKGIRSPWACSIPRWEKNRHTTEGRVCPKKKKKIPLEFCWRNQRLECRGMKSKLPLLFRVLWFIKNFSVS